MEQGRLRVIAYDITDNRRRVRLEKLVGAFAVRVQDSVFEGWLTDSQIVGLLKKARALIVPPEDSLRVYSLCADCGRGVDSLGGTGVHPAPPPDEVIA